MSFRHIAEAGSLAAAVAASSLLSGIQDQDEVEEDDLLEAAGMSDIEDAMGTSPDAKHVMPDAMQPHMGNSSPQLVHGAMQYGVDGAYGYAYPVGGFVSQHQGPMDMDGVS